MTAMRAGSQDSAVGLARLFANPEAPAAASVADALLGGTVDLGGGLVGQVGVAGDGRLVIAPVPAEGAGEALLEIPAPPSGTRPPLSLVPIGGGRSPHRDVDLVPEHVDFAPLGAPRPRVLAMPGVGEIEAPTPAPFTPRRFPVEAAAIPQVVVGLARLLDADTLPESRARLQLQRYSATRARRR